MSHRSLFVVLACTALTSFAGCAQPRGEDPSLLFNRIWVDSTPEKPTDYLHGVFVVPRPALGLFQRSSNYDFHFERFDYRREGQTLDVTFPQTGKTAKITFTVTACQTLPPFDLCLDLSDNPWGGPKRFFGKREQDDDDAALRAWRAHLPAH